MPFYERNPAFRYALRTAAIASALLLSPAIGIVGKPDGNMALPAASAQYIAPDGQNTNTISETANATSVQNASSLLLRGLIGGMMIQDANATGTGGQVTQGDYTVAGRWRMFANDSLVERFVANLTVAKTDGSESHNIIMENIGRPSILAGDTSRITTQVYADSTLPSAVVPITLEIRNKVIRIADIYIDERAIEDDVQRAILQTIDGQSIYGIVEVQRTG